MSPILQYAEFANPSGAHIRPNAITSTVNSKFNTGCRGTAPFVSNPANRNLNFSVAQSLTNIPFSENNQFLNNRQQGGYKFRKKEFKSLKKNKAKGIKKSLKKKLFKKKNTKPKKYYKSKKHHKSKKYHKSKRHYKSKKYFKGGGPLGFAPVTGTQPINTSKILNNIPYSQGFRLNPDDNTPQSTDYGALANPIPHVSYARCPPKLNFN